MSLTNIKKLKEEKGFTIVELLIVIVVIAILAAIVIVAYNGITQRANETTAAANAEAVQKVAEAYATDEGNGDYPTLGELDAWSGGVTRLPEGVNLSADQFTGTADETNGTTIQYMDNGSDTGACVGYWDGSAVQYVYAGAASTGDNSVDPPTCS